MPPSLPVYYFEVEVVSKGREGYIGLGFCTADVNMDRLPGWEPQSYGYHGDDGNAFRSDGKGRKYGPQFETGQPLLTNHSHDAGAQDPAAAPVQPCGEGRRGSADAGSVLHRALPCPLLRWHDGALLCCDAWRACAHACSGLFCVLQETLWAHA